MDRDRPDLTYTPLVYVDRETTERALASVDEDEVAQALLAASFDDADPAWVFERCVSLASDPRPGVRCAVALAIGHLAVPGGFLDDRAVGVLRDLDADPALRLAVAAGRDDVEQALARRRPM